jgi:hypothetical protein
MAHDTAEKIQQNKRWVDLISRVGAAIESLQQLHSELKEEYVREVVFPSRTSEEDLIRERAFAKIGEKSGDDD